MQCTRHFAAALSGTHLWCRYTRSCRSILCLPGQRAPLLPQPPRVRGLAGTLRCPAHYIPLSPAPSDIRHASPPMAPSSPSHSPLARRCSCRGAATPGPWRMPCRQLSLLFTACVCDTLERSRVIIAFAPSVILSVCLVCLASPRPGVMKRVRDRVEAAAPCKPGASLIAEPPTALITAAPSQAAAAAAAGGSAAPRSAAAVGDPEAVRPAADSWRQVQRRH